MSEPEKTRGMEDQEFKALIRVFKFIRAFHHVTEMTTAPDRDSQLARLERMADQISSGIQPAFPKVDTKWLIFGNAKNWLNTSVDILKDHYEPPRGGQGGDATRL